MHVKWCSGWKSQKRGNSEETREPRKGSWGTPKMGQMSTEICGEKLHCTRKGWGQGKGGHLAGDSEGLSLGVMWICGSFLDASE